MQFGPRRTSMSTEDAEYFNTFWSAEGAEGCGERQLRLSTEDTQNFNSFWSAEDAENGNCVYPRRTTENGNYLFLLSHGLL